MTASASSCKNILLVTGGCCHDFDGGAAIMTPFLEGSGRFKVTRNVKQDGRKTDGGVPEFANLPNSNYHVVLLYTQGGTLTQPEEEGLLKFVENGGGLVGIHCAADSFTKNARFMKMIGSKFVTHPPGVFRFQVNLGAKAKAAGHPLVVRSDDFVINDEHYILEMQNDDMEIVATSHLQGKDHPMAYTRRQGKGNVVYLANGHHPESIANPYFLRLLERGLRIATGETFPVKTIHVGIIGYGGAFNMGKAHADGCLQQLGFKVTAVCDLDPKRTAQAKTELGEHIRTYNHLDQFMGDRDIQLAVVILPHNVHAAACIAAAKSGKHVVTEKPFCITLEEADAMIAAADQAGTMLSCFHNRRWDNDFTQLLHVVRSGQIGQVFHADAATAGYGMPGAWWRSSKEISGGVLYDWGAHYCDWLLNLMPKRIASVSGIVHKRHWHNSTNEDFAQCYIRFEDGCTATLEQGSLAAVQRHGWRILGTLGGLSNAGPHQEVTLITYENGLKREAKLSLSPQGKWPNYYQNVANHLQMGERLIVTAQQARRAIGVLRLAELSAQQGGKPLELPGEKDYTPDYTQPL